MKKLLLLLTVFLFTSLVFAGKVVTKKDSLLQVSGTDSIWQIAKGTSAQFVTDKGTFRFNKPLNVNGDSLPTITRVKELIKDSIADNLTDYYTTSEVDGIINDSLNLAVRLVGDQKISDKKTFTDTLQVDKVLKVDNIYTTDNSPIFVNDANTFYYRRYGDSDFLIIQSDGTTEFKGYDGSDMIIALEDRQEYKGSVGSDFLSYTPTTTTISRGDTTFITMADSSLTFNQNIKLTNSATYFDDLFFPFVTGENGSAGSPAFVPDSSYYTFVVDSTGPTQCKKYFTIQMPHKWKEGTTIYPHVHYKHQTAVGTPKFKLKYKWYDTNETTDMGWNWYPMEATTGTTDNTVQMSHGTTGISGATKGISSILICQLYLSDTPANVNAYQFDIHIECDALGSNSETTK